MATEALERRGTLPPVRHGLLAFREDDLPQALSQPKIGHTSFRSVPLAELSPRYVAADIIWSNRPQVQGVTVIFHTHDDESVVDVLEIRPDDIAEDTCPFTTVQKALAIRHERDVLDGRDVILPGTPIRDPELIHEAFWTLTRALRASLQR